MERKGEGEKGRGGERERARLGEGEIGRKPGFSQSI